MSELKIGDKVIYTGNLPRDAAEKGVVADKGLIIGESLGRIAHISVRHGGSKSGTDYEVVWLDKPEHDCYFEEELQLHIPKEVPKYYSRKSDRVYTTNKGKPSDYLFKINSKSISMRGGVVPIKHLVPLAQAILDAEEEINATKV